MATETEPPPREPGRYSSAVVMRVHPEERAALNAAAIAAGLSLQNFCRRAVGLPLPQERKAPYKFSGRDQTEVFSSLAKREGNSRNG